MKRFYREVAVTETEGGFGVALDGKPVRTPEKALLLLPTRALAEAVAAEWWAQGDEVDLLVLPLTRLANSAIDLVAKRNTAIVAEIANYAGTDLVCYRAEHPPALVARQAAAWQPLIDWAAGRHGAPLLVTAGIAPLAQPEASLAALRAAVEAHAPMALAALRLATQASGSLVIALALIEGMLDADAAFATAELDESFQIEQWGEDPEQARRRTGLRDDLAIAARFARLLKE
jgi:chaperone required for assembly of F1-ATPase